MLSVAIIALRVLFGLSLLAAFLLPRFVDSSFDWRRAGLLTAGVCAVLLLGARFGLRATEPERLPASTG